MSNGDFFNITFKDPNLRECTKCHKLLPVKKFWGVFANKTFYLKKWCSDCRRISKRSKLINSA